MNLRAKRNKDVLGHEPTNSIIFDCMQRHLRGANGQLADLLAAGESQDVTAASEEEIRSVRGKLAASEDV